MIDLTLPGDALTASLVDVPSVSGSEVRLADEVELALRTVTHLEVGRDGDTIAARTDLGRDRRIVVAGHLDTVPIAESLPSRRDGERLYGCGSSGKKSGIAVMLRGAASVAGPRHHVPSLFFDNEEGEAARKRVRRGGRQWAA